MKTNHIIISICIMTLGIVHSSVYLEKFVQYENNKVSKAPNNNFNKSFVKHEVKALIRLNKNFKCICGKGFHFPKILHIFDKNIEITNCGQSLDNSKTKIKDIHDHEKQIDCIFENLVKSKIIHLDIESKNICVNEKNVISLIDFDMVHFVEDDIDEPISSGKMQTYWIDNNQKCKATPLMKDIQYNAKNNLKQDRWRKAFFRLMVQ